MWFKGFVEWLELQELRVKYTVTLIVVGFWILSSLISYGLSYFVDASIMASVLNVYYAITGVSTAVILGYFSTPNAWESIGKFTDKIDKVKK
jgi:hypothetical protein